jgi:hypothetical protein
MGMHSAKSQKPKEGEEDDQAQVPRPESTSRLCERPPEICGRLLKCVGPLFWIMRETPGMCGSFLECVRDSWNVWELSGMCERLLECVGAFSIVCATSEMCGGFWNVWEPLGSLNLCAL